VNETGPIAAGRQSVWWRSRYGFAAFWFLSLLAGWQLLRVVLFFAYKPAALPAVDGALAFLSGFHRDCLVALVLTLPLLAWFWLVPERRVRGPWHRRFFWLGCTLFWFVEGFLLFVEFFFFDEFKSRFNTVAVDYLLYPKEVFVNIWESYHVGVFLLVCLGLGLAWMWLARKLFAGMWERTFCAGARFRHLAGAAALAAGLAFTVQLHGAHVSHDRTVNEIANNGGLAFVAAAWTRHLDYAAFYQTLPRDEAYARTRHLLTEPGAQFVEAGASIRRHIAGDPTHPRLNVVLFLEESLGSEFWGCLGRTHTLTPEMDRLADEEGMLFTNLYACGNRTVRGRSALFVPAPARRFDRQTRPVR